MMKIELGFGANGVVRTLRTPFPLTLDLLQDEFTDLSAAELGRALKLAAYWWQSGDVPKGRAAARFFGADGPRGRAAVERHARRFAPSTPLAQMREREIAKARRRLKLDVPPRPAAVVVPFPGTEPRV